MEIQFWSDVVCPWCYLGKRRLEHALEAFDHRDEVHIVHRAFQLDPNAPKGETFDQVDLLTTKHGIPAETFKAQQAKLVHLGQVEGIEYNFEGGRAGNTFDAHRLIRLGLEQGIQSAVIERFFYAHHTEQRSVYEAESLIALSVEAGLDADAARNVLTSNDYSKEVEGDIRQAHEYGANGVPFFVIDDRYGISGAQPRQTFEDALSRAWADHAISGADTN